MTEIKLHNLQKELLKKISLTEKGSRFNELLIDGIESEHMNYHLHKLTELGLVSKADLHYILTDEGKDYVNLMDDDTAKIEKLPKTTVLIIATRKREGTDEDEFLLSKRLEHPYYGKVGFLGGKIRFGESMETALKRELFEETGLSASRIKLLRIYRKIRNRNGTAIQDAIFYRYLAQDISGEFLPRTTYQENIWATAEEVKKRDDLFDNFSLKTVSEYENMSLEYVEDIAEAQDF